MKKDKKVRKYFDPDKVIDSSSNETDVPELSDPETEEPGPSTAIFPDGCVYTGQFDGDLPHGEGTLLYPDLTKKFVGRFERGEVKEGILFKKNSDFYRGTFKDGKFHGHGEYVNYHDIGKYVGGFFDGKYHGRGCLRLSDGSSYEGEFQAGRFVGNGDGIYTWPDGSRYVGEFRNGEFHGEGTIFDKDGEVTHSGRWVYGALVDDFFKKAPVVTIKLSSALHSVSVIKVFGI